MRTIVGVTFEVIGKRLFSFSLEGAYYDMLAELNNNNRTVPSCLYADNDTIAIGACRALKEHGYKIPEDVSIIGMDDIPFASAYSPALTTVRVQKEIIGQLAVTQLLALLDNNDVYRNVKTRLMGELVVRGSVNTI